MVDIKLVRGKTEKEAMAFARIDYGNNFTILSGKSIKTGGILGLGQKNEYEIRIMLHSRRELSNFDEKFQSDKKEIKKHEPIDGTEIGERLLDIRKNIIESANVRNDNHYASRLNNIEDINVSASIVTDDDSNYGKVYNSPRNRIISDRDDDNTDCMQISDILADNKISSENDNYVKNNINIYGYIDKKMESLEDKMRLVLSEFIQNDNTKKITDGHNSNNQNNFNSYNKAVSQRRKTEEERDIDDLENSNMAQIALNRFNNDIQKSDTCLEIGMSAKSNNENAVIEKALDNLRKKEFPDEILEDIREYLLTSSNARFIQSDKVVREEIERFFNENLILKSGIQVSSRKKIIILVGPTGVGKTTTIPKLAATHIRSKRDISFITIDNYRIAAEEQLQKYASIIKVPFMTIKTPEDLRTEVRKMGQNGVLFIDTIGRSPKATRDIVDMSKYFSSIGRFDIDINLLISATSKYNDALNILDTFKVTNYKSVIITKLDETVYLAPVLSAIIKNKVAISNITYGQAVPSDISDAVKGRNRIIKGLYGGVM